MTLLEDRTAVFMVRVWCERGEDDHSANTRALSEWRGSVEHIQSGQRAFFRNLDAVTDFMKPHLEGIGIDAQQRFWERISSAIDAAAAAPDAIPVSVAIPLAVPAAVFSINARKRR